MLRRNITINNVEPAALSLRWPLGVNLDLAVTMKNLRGETIDQTPMHPLLVLLPRSQGGADPYDMEIDAANQSSRALVHGSSLTDVSGYNLEIYQREAGTPPTSIGLLARGALITEGSSYGAHGAMSMANPHIVEGPQGPAGPQGPRGSLWFTGVGAPGTIPGAMHGDLYLDKASGDVWQFENGTWVMT
jgi:hypothetical protein